MTDRVQSPGSACSRYSSPRKTSWSTPGPTIHPFLFPRRFATLREVQRIGFELRLGLNGELSAEELSAAE